MKSDQPPVIPQSWGNRKKIGDTPITPAGEKSPAPLFLIVGAHCNVPSLNHHAKPCTTRDQSTSQQKGSCTSEIRAVEYCPTPLIPQTWGKLKEYGGHPHPSAEGPSGDFLLNLFLNSLSLYRERARVRAKIR